MRAEDLFPGDGNELSSNNVKLRKGTIGACIKNASLLKSTHDTEEKKAILKQIAEYANGLVQVFDWTDHITWKNPDIQKVFEEATKKTTSNAG